MKNNLVLAICMPVIFTTVNAAWSGPPGKRVTEFEAADVTVVGQ